jgi:NIPSNAP protein
MQRREFLAASAATVLGLTAANGAFAANEAGARQFYELRRYHFPSEEKQQAFETFLAETAIPAMNRAGVEPVGVWTLAAKDNPQLKLTADPMELFVFLPHNSLESVVTLEQRLAADEAYQKAGHSILYALKKDAPYTRYESTLLHAMENFPRMQTPMKSETRVLELRTYESPGSERAKNKLDMFNAGEFDSFVKAGMKNVFFGGAIIGENLPQLTYMVAHENLDAAKKNWSAFGKVPEWKALSSNRSYNGNVSNIIDRYLRPAKGSQV